MSDRGPNKRQKHFCNTCKRVTRFRSVSGETDWQTPLSIYDQSPTVLSSVRQCSSCRAECIETYEISKASWRELVWKSTELEVMQTKLQKENDYLKTELNRLKSQSEQREAKILDVKAQLKTLMESI